MTCRRMFPVCAIGLVLTPWLLTLKPPNATLREKFAKIDWVGGGLFIASSTSFLIGKVVGTPQKICAKLIVLQACRGEVSHTNGRVLRL